MKIQFKKEGIDCQWLLDMAKTMSKYSTSTVEIKDDKILFPKDIGSGYISHHQLGDDIELAIYNHTYKMPVCIERIPTEETQFYVMHINCSPDGVSYFSNGKERRIAGPQASSVFWSASNISSCVKMEAGESFVGVIVYMTKKFLQNILGEDLLDSPATEANRIIADSTHQYDLSGNKANKAFIDQTHNISRTVQSKIGKMKYELVQEIINLGNSSSVPEKLLLRANVIKILALFIKRIASKIDRDEESNHFNDTSKILQVKKTIDENAGSEHISLDDLAKAAAMSKTKLKTKFKEIVGQTTYQYYLSVKMEKARAILEDNPTQITTVAYELGYKSTSHFSQAFKKQYGVTPKSIAAKI